MGTFYDDSQQLIFQRKKDPTDQDMKFNKITVSWGILALVMLAGGSYYSTRRPATEKT